MIPCGLMKVAAKNVKMGDKIDGWQVVDIRIEGLDASRIVLTLERWVPTSRPTIGNETVPGDYRRTRKERACAGGDLIGVERPKG